MVGTWREFVKFVYFSSMQVFDWDSSLTLSTWIRRMSLLDLDVEEFIKFSVLQLRDVSDAILAQGKTIPLS